MMYIHQHETAKGMAQSQKTSNSASKTLSLKDRVVLIVDIDSTEQFCKNDQIKKINFFFKSLYIADKKYHSRAEL